MQKTLVVFHYEFTKRYPSANEWTNGFDRVEDTVFGIVIPSNDKLAPAKAHDVLFKKHPDDEYFRVLSESYYPVDLEIHASYGGGVGA